MKVIKRVNVSADTGLNGRIGPGTMFPVFHVYPKGRELEVVYQDNPYVAVLHEGAILWVHKLFLTDSAELEEPDLGQEEWKFNYSPLGANIKFWELVTQRFGANPANYVMWGLKGHEGIDFAVAEGTPIHAVRSGLVYHVCLDPREKPPGESNYGIHVRVQHELGYQSVYAHLTSTAVSRGDNVLAGTLLGYSGNTGRSTGPHLHFGLKRVGYGPTVEKFNFIDPTPFFDDLRDRMIKELERGEGDQG